MVQEASKQADMGHTGALCKPKSGMLNLLLLGTKRQKTHPAQQLMSKRYHELQHQRHTQD